MYVSDSHNRLNYKLSIHVLNTISSEYFAGINVQNSVFSSRHTGDVAPKQAVLVWNSKNFLQKYTPSVFRT